MITFKINSTPYSIPTSWTDVTYHQYIQLISALTITDHISIFTGIPVETLEDAELKNLESIGLALSFMTTTPSFERTEVVGPYIMPMDITIQSTGQFEALRGLINKIPARVITPEDHELVADLYLEACAIYIQKIKDGKYDYTKVKDVKEELKNYSCAEVIGTGAFFLFKPHNLSKTTTNRFLNIFRLLKRWILALPSYQKTLVSLQRYFGQPVK